MDAHRKKIGALLAMAIVGFLIAISLYNIGQKWDDITQPLGYISLAILVISVILLAFSESVFRRWKKFALWYIPLSVVLIAITSDQNHFILPIDRELVTWWTAGGFVVISLLLMGYAAWRDRHHEIT